MLDLAADLQRYAITRPIHSIFIGGGTPSLFSPESLIVYCDGIEQQITLQENMEITLEANPGTFESQKFAEFRALGINRLSIGVQTFNEALLKKLGRVHSAREAIIAAEIAHQAGFDNFNLDLMFGLPDDDFDSLNDVNSAISLQPTHISFYQLTLEPNTYFHKFPPQLPNDEHIFAMQQRCQQQLAAHGYHNMKFRHTVKRGDNANITSITGNLAIIWVSVQAHTAKSAIICHNPLFVALKRKAQNSICRVHITMAAAKQSPIANCH